MFAKRRSYLARTCASGAIGLMVSGRLLKRREELGA